MLQALRDYWLPRLLFAGTILVAVGLLALVVAVPFVVEHFQINIRILTLFADDATVRRSSIAGAIGLIVTAWVFFRPKAAEPTAVPKKPPGDTMAGA